MKRKSRKRKNLVDFDALWTPKRIAEVKKNMLAQFGPNATAQSIWGTEKYQWVDSPKSDQDIIYNKILYDWSGRAYKMQTRVPDTEWLVHFSHHKFTRFSKGRYLEDNIMDNQFAVGHAAYLMELDCDSPDMEFGFQYAWSSSHLIYDKYYAESFWGQNALLFRSDSAVQHLGDGGEVLFRACSERDVLSFHFVGTVDRGRPGVGYWESDDTQERFNTWFEVVLWADKRFKIKRKWPLPVPGLFSSVDDFKIWADGMLKGGWTAPLKRDIKDVLAEIAKLES